MPVVLVVFDELPLASLLDQYGRVDAAMFPNFARLQRNSTWFRNTTTVATFTREAVPALMTGTVPERPYAPGHSYRPQNLFTLLGGAYRIHALENLPGLCPLTWCNASKIHANDDHDLAAFNRSARGMKVGSFLDLVRPDLRGHFYFLHLVLPHEPWRYLPTGQRYFETEPVPGEVDPVGRGKGWNIDRWLATQAWQRHLLQLGLVDNVLGKMIRELKERGVYDDALFVVTADHGHSFEPGFPKRLLNQETLGYLAPVPFFVKAPHQRSGSISDAPVQTIDLLPTIADVLDLTNVWRGVDGVSAFSFIDEDRRRTIGRFELTPEGSELTTAVSSKFERLSGWTGIVDHYGIAPPGGRALLPYLGADVEDLGVHERDDVAVVLSGAGRYDDASSSAEAVPALIEGNVRGFRQPAHRVIAIAVDGKLAAVTRTYHDRGAMRFYAMVPPDAFGEPPNDIEVFLYERGTGTLGRLRRIP